MKILKIQTYNKWVKRYYVTLLIDSKEKTVFYDINKETWSNNATDLDLKIIEEKIKKIIIVFYLKYGLWILGNTRESILKKMMQMSFSEITNLKSINVYLENNYYYHGSKSLKDKIISLDAVENYSFYEFLKNLERG